MRNYILLGLIVLASCKSKPSTEQEKSPEVEMDEKSFTVSPAPEWTELFLRKKGWFGGDGIFAIPFSGKDSEKKDSVLFVFSDTMIGEIENEKLLPGYVMVNNSVAVLKDKAPNAADLTFKIATDAGKYKAIFTPNLAKPDKDIYYWLGDGFVNPDAGNDLFIFAYKIQNTNDQSQFPFKEIGNSLIRIPKGSTFPYKDQKQSDLPFNTYQKGEESISFGAGLFNNAVKAGEPDADGFLYVYGIKGIAKKLVCARMKPESVESFDKWEFWDGRAWSGQVQNAAALSDSVSNEMSMSRLRNGKYALVYQLGGIFPDICMQVGATPVGPFGPRIVLYKTSNDLNDPDLFTYNAKAHPSLATDDELLISYNVNSFKFFEVVPHKPNLYRPRFIRVKFNQTSTTTKPSK